MVKVRGFFAASRAGAAVAAPQAISTPQNLEVYG
jgi:hypothetical protein